MRTVIVSLLLLSACGSSAAEQPDPDPAPSRNAPVETTTATTTPTSGGEGNCTAIDPWSPTGQSAAPCPQGSTRASQPPLDPFADAGTR